MSIDTDYIDAPDALKRVGGNKGLYVKLLRQFVDSGYFDILKGAIDAGDIEAAVREAHSIKGVAANLSLPKLNASAVELEAKLRDNEDCSVSLENMKDVYDATSKQISDYCRDL